MAKLIPFRNSVNAPNQDTEAVSFSPTFHNPMQVQSCKEETCQEIFMPPQPIFETAKSNSLGFTHLHFTNKN
jgi:hypothetical protein